MKQMYYQKYKINAVQFISYILMYALLAPLLLLLAAQSFPSPTYASSLQCDDGTAIPAQGILQAEGMTIIQYCTEAGSSYNGQTSGSEGPLPSRVEADCSEEQKANENEGPLHPDNCGITHFILMFTNALSVLVGIVVVMALVIGGIQYSSAGSNPQAVAAAKKRISQALLALLIYIFMFAFLQWLVPGGVL